MGQTYASGAVGGLITLEGETDITRTSQTVNITSNTTQLVLGTGVTGVGLQLTVDCDINGRVAVSNIVDKGSGFATGNKLTIPALYSVEMMILFFKLHGYYLLLLMYLHQQEQEQHS
ncbi:MAG: hypothetical protein CM15mV4_0330 [Caudoviricetes sp.]|nr:MAG: hypothetical protein CM15mV4_0330 [Caudoviricetes sp.]